MSICLIAPASAGGFVRAVFSRRLDAYAVAPDLLRVALRVALRAAVPAPAPVRVLRWNKRVFVSRVGIGPSYGVVASLRGASADDDAAGCLDAPEVFPAGSVLAQALSDGMVYAAQRPVYRWAFQ